MKKKKNGKNRWLQYELEKRKIQLEILTPDEYEKAIQELCNKYKI